MSLDFAAVLDPVAIADFVEDYWERRPLHVERGDPTFFERLLPLAELDFLLATHTGEPDFALSVIGWRRGDEANRPQRKPGRSALTPKKVYELLAGGATIRIGGIPRYVEPVKRLVDSFESVLNTDIAVNAYVTPHAAQAFAAHVDNHDVYVLQVHGEKHWRIFEPAVELPVEVMIRGRTNLFAERPPYDNPQPLRPPSERVREVTVRAGDVLYVPRGYPHEAETGESLSVHLTVAAPVITWYEALVAALPRALPRSAALRRGLPPRFAADPAVLNAAAAQAETVVEALAATLGPDDLRAALDELATQFVYSRRPGRDGLIERVDRSAEVELDTVLRIRPSLIHRVEVIPPHLHLLYSGESFRLPIRAASMIDHIREHGRFTPRSLPTTMPETSRLLLSRSLVERGFLEIEEANPDDDGRRPGARDRSGALAAHRTGGLGPDS